MRKVAAEHHAPAWAAIRVDASQAIGSGHFMRCLALADAARGRGLKIFLLHRELEPGLQQRVTAAGLQQIRLRATDRNPTGHYHYSHWLAVAELTDADESTRAVEAISAQLGPPVFIAVDHYALGAPWHGRLRSLAPVIAIDELADRPMAPDWLLDQAVGKTERDYAGLLAEYCRPLLGGRYALLRPEFERHAATLRYRRSVPAGPASILLTMGGVDPANATGKLLGMLREIQCTVPLHVTAVAGAAFRHLDELKALCGSLPEPARLLVDCNNMAELMAGHHLAIGAAGTTAWERCAMGLPSLNLVLADNQADASARLAQCGAAIDLGRPDTLSTAVLQAAIEQCLGDATSYGEMVTAGFAAIDGQGCARLLDILLDAADD